MVRLVTSDPASLCNVATIPRDRLTSTYLRPALVSTHGAHDFKEVTFTALWLDSLWLLILLMYICTALAI